MPSSGWLSRWDFPRTISSNSALSTTEGSGRSYFAATAVVVTSVAEGFSIPIAEAVLRGTPVVASDIAVHRELLGEGPLLAPSRDVGSLARAIAATVAHPGRVAATQRQQLGTIADAVRVRTRITEAIQPLSTPRRHPPARRRSGLRTT